ncbi:hypothetical protein [Actinokineospora sp. NPDC004072]
MRDLGFPCAYTRAAGAGDPCGRRATRRRHGEPKCLGHWAVDYLLTLAGGTEHARKTWAVASAALLLLAAGSTWWLRGPTIPHAVTAVLLTGALVVCFFWEHPAGGVAALVAALATAVVWARGSGFGYLLLNPDAPIPPGSTRTQQLLITSIDAQVAFVVLFSAVGFIMLYFFNNNSEVRFWRGFALLVAVVLTISVTIYAIASGGRSTVLVPWVAVVALATLVARGGRLARKIAGILRV